MKDFSSIKVKRYSARHLLGFLFLYLLFCSGSLHAEKMQFIPRASVSIAEYDFTQSARPNALAPSGINNNDFPEVTFNVTFKILGIGGTFFKNDYYFDLSYAKSLKEEDSFTLDDPAIPGGSFTENFKGDREDYAFTFGKKILERRGGVYIGYKGGTSEAAGDQGTDLKFKEKGFFLGGNYGWPVSDAGVISVNLAYAWLDGDLTERVTNPLFTSLPIPLDTDASSDATGVSYGISWSAGITDKLSYSVGIDAKKYTFEDVKDSNPNAIPSDEFEEEFNSLSFSMYYLF